MFYFLDTDPQRAARLLADVDVHGVTAVETLAGVVRGMRIRTNAGAGEVNALTPWVMRCRCNWDWAVAYTQEIVSEHIYRFGRLHPGVRKFAAVLSVDALVRSRLPKAGVTHPPLVIGNGTGIHLGMLGLMAVSYVTMWQWRYGAMRRGAIYTKRGVPEFIEERRVVRERRRAPHDGSAERRHPPESVKDELDTQARVAVVGRVVSEGQVIRIRRVRPCRTDGDDSAQR